MKTGNQNKLIYKVRVKEYLLTNRNNENRQAKSAYIVPEKITHKQVDPTECYKVFFNKRRSLTSPINTVLNNQGH
jgi:hypothetical protein